MPLPPGLAKVTVSGKALRTGTGEPLTGRITFTPDTPQIRDTSSGAFITGSVTVAPDASGNYTATVLAPDSPGISPSGWGYTITICLDSALPYVFHATLSKNTPVVKMTDLIQAA